MIRLVIASPAYGGKIDFRQSRMWFSLGHAACANEEQFTVRAIPCVDRCGVDVARNETVLAALSAAYDPDEPEPFGGAGAWLLMVDADTWADNDLQEGYDLLAMIAEGERRKAGVIAAAVRPRGPDMPHMVYRERTDPEEIAKAKGLRYAAIGSDVWSGRVCEVDGIATALFAVNLKALLSIPPPWFDYRYVRPGTLDSVGEDLYCCEQLRARGWKIYVDGRVATKHAGRAVVY